MRRIDNGYRVGVRNILEVTERNNPIVVDGLEAGACACLSPPGSDIRQKQGDAEHREYGKQLTLDRRLQAGSPV